MVCTLPAIPSLDKEGVHCHRDSLRISPLDHPTSGGITPATGRTSHRNHSTGHKLSIPKTRASQPQEAHHRVGVYNLPDGRLAGVLLEALPAVLGWNPEDVFDQVLIRVFRVGSVHVIGFEFSVLLFEGIGEVLEEDKPQDDVLVLGCVHRTT